jgi:hypothetical protein
MRREGFSGGRLPAALLTEGIDDFDAVDALAVV